MCPNRSHPIWLVAFSFDLLIWPLECFDSDRPLIVTNQVHPLLSLSSSSECLTYRRYLASLQGRVQADQTQGDSLEAYSLLTFSETRSDLASGFHAAVKLHLQAFSTSWWFNSPNNLPALLHADPFLGFPYQSLESGITGTALPQPIPSCR
jgi:hypothetical protein